MAGGARSLAERYGLQPSDAAAASPVSPGSARVLGFDAFDAFSQRRNSPVHSREAPAAIAPALSSELLQEEQWAGTETSEARHLIGNVQAGVAIFKAVVGPGFLFLPAAVKRSGVFSAMFLTAIAGMLSARCMLLVVRSARSLRSKGIQVAGLGDIGFAAYGRAGQLAVEFAVVTAQLGCCTFYCVFVAGNVQSVIYEAFGGFAGLEGEGEQCQLPWPFDTARLVYLVILVAILPLTPLTWVRQIKYFAFTNIVASVLVLGTVFFMLFAFMVALSSHGHAPGLEMFQLSGSLVFFGSVMYAYEGVGVLLPVERSMASPDDFEHVAWWTMILVTVQMMMFSLSVYLLYGEHTETLITVTLARGKLLGGLPAAVAIQAAWLVVVLFTFPLQMFPAARTLESMFLHERRSGWKWVKNGLRGCLVVAVIGVAEFGYDHVGNFVAVIGAMSCVPLAVVYPALFHHKLMSRPCLSSATAVQASFPVARPVVAHGGSNGNNGSHHSDSGMMESNQQSVHTTGRALSSDLIIVFFGTAGVLVALVAAIHDWITENPEAKICIARTN